MRRRKRTLLAHQKRQLAATLYGLIGLGASARAQQVLMPPPSYPTTPPAVEAERESGGGYVGGFQSFLSTAENPAYWLTWGPVVVHPSLSYSATYSSGINTAPGQANNSFIQSITPGVGFNVGTHWVLSYQPTFTYYSSSDLKDTVNHSVTLTGGGSYVDWVYGLSQTYNLSGDPNAQTGAQTSIQTYTTALNASYRFSSLISSDVTFNQTITSADQFNSTTTWTGTDYLNFQFFPTLTTGVGVTYSYDENSVGPNMQTEQLQARIEWRASRKFSLSLNAGVGDNQFIGGGVPDVISPVFGATISYAAAPHTSLSLTASRSLTPSILFSQASETTTVGVGLTQRFLKHFDFNANVTYSRIDYLATVQNLNVYVATQNPNVIDVYNVNYLTPNRTDSAYGLNASLGWAIRSHLSFSLTYAYNRDASSANGLSYATSQEGFLVSYHF